MGTLPLWLGFNAAVAILLLLDLGLFHRRSHVVSLREAALESAVWVSLSCAFGLWIFHAHGRASGLEFFTGYVIEKSLSVDNVFIFLLIFQFFRVDPRYQHRMLFWGVLGALVLRGLMIGVGVVLIDRFAWILYLFGAFLVYSGFKMFGAKHSVHPEKNPVMRWAQNFLPLSTADAGERLFVREGGRWLATRLFLVIVVLETTDLVFAVDSIPAIFGVTRDPFLVYTSNVCAILGLRAFYFLLAGILPYFMYLDEGLAIVLIFIGGKMLGEHWIHISTEVSLGIVGGVIAIAVGLSMMSAKKRPVKTDNSLQEGSNMKTAATLADFIRLLTDPRPDQRTSAAYELAQLGRERSAASLDIWTGDEEFRGLIVREESDHSRDRQKPAFKMTTGIAVSPEMFQEIRKANQSPALADVPPDQDALEFELEFDKESLPPARLDILTTKAPAGSGAIARYLEKLGEGIQQVEIDVTNVDRATEILRARFKQEPIYPATRAGANGTRVNFFLATDASQKKVLVELVEQANQEGRP